MALADEIKFENRSIKSGGDVEATRNIITGLNDQIVAGTTQTQAGATPLNQQNSIILTCANEDDGVKILIAKAKGTIISILNGGVEAAQVWPELLGTIDSGSVDAVDVNKLLPGELREYISTDLINWKTYRSILNAAAPGGYETVTGTNVILSSENGKTFILNATGAFVSTLPTPIAGLKFKFIIGGTEPTTSHTIVTNGSANIIEGVICTSDDAAGDVATVADADTVSFIASKAIHGDWCELECDGTNWYVSGMCDVFDGMTTTQAS